MAKQADAAPRIAPATRAEMGAVNHLIARVIGAATGAGPPNVFTTLARHRGLFRAWLRFAGALMPGGRLPRDESELLILRIAHNCGSDYEWDQHERLGKQAGLSDEEIARVREGAGAGGWSSRRALLLTRRRRAARRPGDLRRHVGQLTGHLNDVELIELCMLVGHYEMLAMTLNSLRVAPDGPPTKTPPRVLRAAQARIERRGSGGKGRT